MRWRLVDRIDGFERWASISGRKTVSLEEYCLHEPLGRRGVLPESLVLESCVEILRWLAAKSSDFQRTCVLSGVEKFAFHEEIGMGHVLSISASVVRNDEHFLVADCRVHVGAKQVAEGRLEVGFLALPETSEPDDTRMIWQELYASA